MRSVFLLLLLGLGAFKAQATPYPFPGELKVMPQYQFKSSAAGLALAEAERVLRVQVNWHEDESYHLAHAISEMSGTPGRRLRALKADPYGSYQAQLKVGETVYYDALGTGKEYRKLVPSLTFRFSFPSEKAVLKVWAEHPQSGVRELVLTQTIDPAAVAHVPPLTVESRLIQPASVPEALTLAIYAEGYRAERKARFFERAQKVVQELKNSGMPGVERFNFLAVFAPSKEQLGAARDLGSSPVKRDSFLGLYFPHWNKFGRWYHVVYPTDEHQFRSALASVAYDYPLALVDDGAYWGVGNYLTHTAIPAESGQFTYLLLHEFGHFLGLNEEYEEAGPTELEFAPGIAEPWSPNITFHPKSGELKWEHLVEPGTPLPTPASFGGWGRKITGAFRGGYAGSQPTGRAHKPVKSCTMGSGGGFCPVCAEAITKQLAKDAGE